MLGWLISMGNPGQWRERKREKMPLSSHSYYFLLEMALLTADWNTKLGARSEWALMNEPPPKKNGASCILLWRFVSPPVGGDDEVVAC